MISTMKIRVSVVICIVLLGILPSSNTSNLQIIPRHIHRRPSDKVQVQCVIQDPITPITNCSFRSYYKGVFNLDAGPLTNKTKYSYIGDGLEAGQCGIELSPYKQNNIHDIIECQVRTVEHGWQYASAVIEIYDGDSKTPYSVTPIVATVQNGSNIHVLGHADAPLRACSSKWVDDSWVHFDQNDHLTAPENDRNLGNGLAQGDCAIVLYNVQRRGFVIFLAFKPTTPQQDTALSHMTVIIPKAPETPELTVSNTAYSDGDELEATCVIKNAIPVSNITWYFGDEVIRNDSIDEATDTTSNRRWSFERHNIAQSVRRRLTWEDGGKELVCRAEHLELPGGQLDAKEVITVYYAPRLLEVNETVDSLDFNVGDDGVITCRCRADPPPLVNWKFDQAVAGSAVAAGRYNWTLVNQGGNVWIASLTIYNLTPLDNAQMLNIEVHNPIGTLQQTVIFDVNNGHGELGHGELGHGLTASNDKPGRVGLIFGLLVLLLILTCAIIFAYRQRVDVINWYRRHTGQSETLNLKNMEGS